jgi:putative ABC transport system substrate-binding protein
MRRRQFMATLAAVGLSRTLTRAARAEASLRVIGFVAGATPPPHLLSAFHRGLNEAGYAEGRNVRFETRWVADNYTALPTVMTELVDAKVDLIVVAGGTQAALAAKAASDQIPVVFLVGADQVQFGLAANLRKPGGNVTGVSLFAGELATKRLALLKELVPTATVLGALINPASTSAKVRRADLTAAGQALGMRLIVAEASTDAQLHAAFGTLAENGVQGVVVQNDVFFNSFPEKLTALAARYRLPAIYEGREYASAGGLITYGPNRAEQYHQLGDYAGRVLAGASPGELPIQQPTKFEIVINARAAKELGLSVPLTLQAQADEVIE